MLTIDKWFITLSCGLRCAINRNRFPYVLVQNSHAYGVLGPPSPWCRPLSLHRMFVMEHWYLRWMNWLIYVSEAIYRLCEVLVNSVNLFVIKFSSTIENWRRSSRKSAVSRALFIWWRSCTSGHFSRRSYFDFWSSITKASCVDEKWNNYYTQFFCQFKSFYFIARRYVRVPEMIDIDQNI